MKESWLIIKLENVAIAMHCNLRPPDAAPVLIRFNYDVHAKFKVAEPIHCVFGTDTLLYTVTLSFDFWPWTFAVYRLWRDETLYQIWTQSSYPRRSYCDFNIWPNDLEHVLRVALDFGIIFDKFVFRQLIRAWIIAFFDADTLCHAVTLTFNPLTLKVRGTSSVTWSKCERNLSDNTNYYSISNCERKLI